MGIRRNFAFGTLCVLIAVTAMTFRSTAQDPPASENQAKSSETKLRIGVYDSRAIAIAYAPSKFNPVGEKMQAFQQAKSEGDTDKMQELENWGKRHQRELHRQGFSIVPVTKLLEHVRDQLPAVARNAQVVAITRECDFIGEQIELVDVTDRLVELFEPSEKTLKTVMEIRKVAPIDLDQLTDRND